MPTEGRLGPYIRVGVLGASRDSWTFEHSEARLRDIMIDVHSRCHETAEEYGAPGNYIAGANIAGYARVAEAMLALGLI